VLFREIFVQRRDPSAPGHTCAGCTPAPQSGAAPGVQMRSHPSARSDQIHRQCNTRAPLPRGIDSCLCGCYNDHVSGLGRRRAQFQPQSANGRLRRRIHRGALWLDTPTQSPIGPGERSLWEARHVPGTRPRGDDEALCLGLGHMAQVAPRPVTPLYEDGTSVLCPCERAAERVPWPVDVGATWKPEKGYR